MPIALRAFAPGSALAAAFALLIVSPPALSADLVLRAPDDLRDSVAAASLTQSAIDEGRTEPQDLIAAAQADYRRVLAALYEEGYFSAEVHVRVDGTEAAALSPLRPPARVGTVEISVTPGPVFTFGRAEVAPLPATATPLEGFAPGRPAGTEIMRDAAEDGVGDWRQAGHAKARVSDQSIVADHASNRVDARFRITPGPRLTFAPARLAPESFDSAVRPERIRAIAGVPEGEIYDPDEIDQAERRLRRTGAFRVATVTEAEEIGPGDTLGTVIEVEDAEPRRFGFGAEVSTVEGLRLTTFWLHRNAFGGAERLRFDAEVAGIGGQTGGIDYSLAASLTRPAFRHPDAQLTFRALIEREDEPTYLSDRLELAVGVDRIIDEQLTLRGEVGLRVARTTDAFGTRDFSHVLLTGGATWDNRDSATDPRDGAYAEAELMPFVGVSGSESGIRSTAEIRGYRPLGDRLVLAGRVQLGAVFGPAIADTPPDFLFYSGGGGTVRGQGYQSLGVGSGANKTGGRSFAALSAELRADVTEKIGAVVFADYGYVAASSSFEGGSWHGGAGIGVRYKTGIGPIRADIATPVTGGRAGDSISLYVGIGQAF
ncbi:outer membrane protein, OMP85 family protein [Pseudooceanicola batsensis HTCC2597]|uniref:Outer membrane protein, OMP85 family protein n=1 Tax=Pseudooceanicola batsensis (strain ATCC BAA-863 / DSM 15984 / KCTC 12145 / HTCC2597) TaxID=252305 RepID=A3U2G7_PSEBH|nr:BamA/TamA family outer membrane protein [Pseudooceanicola batsensis]EAQ01767.1 outer membrane protein, OMP85 family protein [Pseudooceanicola batsensis HTCC2597]